MDDPNASYNELDQFEPGKTYYIKVCEAISPDSCGVYSNEVNLSF